MPLYFCMRNGAEMNHKGETNTFEIGLLSKLEIIRPEIFFSAMRKKFFRFVFSPLLLEYVLIRP